MKVSIIIPAFNEKNTIREVVARAEKADTLGLEKEIILVDDCSRDGTREIIQELGKMPGKKIVLHEKNQGVGAAWRHGIEAASGDIMIRQDADTEYQPEDFPIILGPIIEGNADVVYGSRILGFQKSKYRYQTYLWGGLLVNWLINQIVGTRLSDILTASKTFHKSIFDKISLESVHFEIESELTAKVKRAGLRLVEVPVTYRARSFEEGKKIRWHHAFRLLRAAFTYRFAPLKK